MSYPAEPIYDVEAEAVVPLIAATAVPVESVTIVQVTAPATLSTGTLNEKKKKARCRRMQESHIRRIASFVDDEVFSAVACYVTNSYFTVRSSYRL